MSNHNLFAYDSEGTVIVTADGAELLVHSGDDGEPLWRQTLKSKILALATTGEEVVILCRDGTLSWWDAEHGERNDQVELDGEEYSCLAVDPDGIAAVVVDGALELVAPGEETRSVQLPGANCVAWSADGGLLAVGSKDGNVWVLDEQDLEVDEPVSVGAKVTGLAWNSQGCWLVTAGDGVFEVEESGEKQKLLARLTGSEPRLITCAQDGAMFALRRDPTTVEALSWPSGETVGTVRYQDRKVVGLALGPELWLGIGLDHGDGNRVSLRSETVHRTKTFEGRTHRSWMLEVTVRGASTRKKGKREAAPAATPPKPKLPKSEAELNAPDWQTLVMLGVIAVATVGMWTIAYLPIPGIGESCNAHPPDSKKANKIAKTEDLAAKPKDAAIEAIQRWTSQDFAGASELVKGQALGDLKKAQQDCEANKSACEAQKKELEGKVETMADVLSRDGSMTRLRVITRVGSNEQKYVVEVEPDGKIFKVVRRAADS